MIQEQFDNLDNFQPRPLLPHYSHIANLNLICLSKEIREKQAGMRGYWYLVQQGIYPYITFRKSSSLLRWAAERGLEFEESLPAFGTWKTIRIQGSYQEVK